MAAFSFLLTDLGRESNVEVGHSRMGAFQLLPARSPLACNGNIPTHIGPENSKLSSQPESRRAARPFMRLVEGEER
ncbi:hypothetical protein TNCV_108361 [Trichonephila clavipes]|nr:hypothetical protein TNCV_108361 [Trichonephila clavipes]